VLLQETGAHYFVRTHRSYVVNINHIKSIEKHNKKAWDINFYNYEEIALIGDKYSVDVINRIEGGR
jgi:DNA-binding LytR/AlgR family response regulator